MHRHRSQEVTDRHQQPTEQTWMHSRADDEGCDHAKPTTHHHNHIHSVNITYAAQRHSFQCTVASNLVKSKIWNTDKNSDTKTKTRHFYKKVRVLAVFNSFCRLVVHWNFTLTCVVFVAICACCLWHNKRQTVFTHTAQWQKQSVQKKTWLRYLSHRNPVDS